MDIEVIPSLYTWIRNNWITFTSVTIVLLTIYGVYNFIDGYAKPFGAAIASQHEDLKRAVASYTALDTILNKDLSRYHASRAGLFRFHDSERDVSRMAFFFVSVANMVAAPGVTVDLPDITNLPAQTYSPILPTLMENKPFFSSIKNIEPGAYRELEMKRGTKEIFVVPIDDLQDNLIGFISMVWLSEEDVPQGDDREKMIATIQADAVRISGFFSLGASKDRK